MPMISREDKLRERLAVFYDAFEVAMWIMLPHPQLAGETPRHAIDAGHIGEVEDILARLETGAYL